MDKFRTIKFLAPLGLVIVVFGTLGFMVLERVGLLSALYMTVITITTVGYGEVIPLDSVGRIFTIGLIIVGYGYLIVTGVALTQVVVAGELQRQMGRRKLSRTIDRLRNHVVLAGCGRMGHVVLSELMNKRSSAVVIDSREEVTRELDALGVLYVQGNATEESVLHEAGLDHAKTLIITLSSDADAVFTCLTAREINPNLEIIVRAIDSGAERRLRAAGATRVINLYSTVGRSMANVVLHPEIMDILDMAVLDTRREFRMEGHPVAAESELAGKTLRDAPIRQKLGLIIIGIKKREGHMLFNPASSDVIEPGDVLISMGEVESLRELERWLNPNAH